MIRKLLLPALAAALLGGCVTGYDYRGGTGDYYYGQPSYQSDYYGPYGYGGYGYPGGWSGMLGYGYGYGGGYGGYGYGYPYYGYGYPYYPPVIIIRPDPPSAGPGRGDLHQGDPNQAGPAPTHGRGHNWSPYPSVPMMEGRQSAPERRLRIDPTPYPGQPRIQHQPSQSTRPQMRESPRPQRDDGLKPHP